MILHRAGGKTMRSDSLRRVFEGLAEEKRHDELDRYAAGREYARRMQIFDTVFGINGSSGSRVR
jgi:hypothetical protein